MKTFAAAAIATMAAAVDTSNHWAVIMAGSTGYSNYRHQSDSAHAMKIMLQNGIPRDQIIHLAYDDIADNIRNPFPGQIFNILQLWPDKGKRLLSRVPDFGSPLTSIFR